MLTHYTKMADMVKTVLSENQLLGTVMLYSTASYPVHGHIFSQLLHCLSYCRMQDIKSHNPSRCFFLPELLLVMTLNRIYSVDLVFELFCSTTLISKVSNENWSFRALHCTTSTFFSVNLTNWASAKVDVGQKYAGNDVMSLEWHLRGWFTGVQGN